MDVFSIIRSSFVSDGVNPIGQYYRLVKQVGGAGQELVWKIYDAVRIKDGKVRQHQLLLFYLLLNRARNTN